MYIIMMFPLAVPHCLALEFTMPINFVLSFDGLILGRVTVCLGGPGNRGDITCDQTEFDGDR